MPFNSDNKTNRNKRFLKVNNKGKARVTRYGRSMENYPRLPTILTK
jgi:hypothetical protein